MKHTIVSETEWIEKRKELLAMEKALTKQRDAVAEARRALPWVKIEKNYVFEGPNGKETLSDLFDGRSQLIVYHFMLGPGWKEGCPGCSFLSDHFDGPNLHLKHHDVTLLAVSRATFPEIERFKQRMGWQFKWVSSNGTDFNYDFHVSATKEELAKGQMMYNYKPAKASEEEHGMSFFYKDENGDVFHTYSSYARGDEDIVGAYMFIDRTPLGRRESGPMDWVRLHDAYETPHVQISRAK